MSVNGECIKLLFAFRAAGQLSLALIFLSLRWNRGRRKSTPFRGAARSNDVALYVSTFHNLIFWRLLPDAMKAGMFFLAAVVLVAVFLLAACRTQPSPAEQQLPPALPSADGALTDKAAVPAASEQKVSIVSFRFEPASLEIKSGTTVVWTNDDSAMHSVLGDGFSSQTLQHGDSFSHTFTAPGTYAYRCGLHSGMIGTVLVK